MQLHIHVYLTAGECVCVCLLLWRVGDWARSCACVSLFFSHVFVCLSVGLLRGGLLAVKRPRDVRVRTGSQHPLLQEEVLGVGQVRGAPLPPGRQRVLLAHSSAAPSTMEQLAHRLVWNSFWIFFFFFLFQIQISHWAYVFHKNTFYILYV